MMFDVDDDGCHDNWRLNRMLLLGGALTAFAAEGTYFLVTADSYWPVVMVLPWIAWVVSFPLVYRWAKSKHAAETRHLRGV